MDWTHCPDVECIPGKVSGQWLVRGTRIPADALIENAEDGFSPEQIAAEIYPSIPVGRVRNIIAYAKSTPNAARSA
jgi:uncharacterized protein (DUF433 family)